MHKKSSFIHSVLAGLFLGAPAVFAQTSPTVVDQLYSGLTISGTLGTSYSIEYNTKLGATNWTLLTNVVLTANPMLWVDTTSAATATRFYRVLPTAATNSPAPSGMVSIPAGSFVMGDSLDGESDAPETTVYVNAFYMDENLVTLALWQQIHTWAAGNGYSFDNAGSGNASTQPVESIDWYDAVKWCNARSQVDGVPPVYYSDAALTQVYKTGDTVPYVNWSAAGYRLPTEAEWEKAARGGLAKQRFPLGNTISEAQANYYGNPTVFSYDEGPAGYDPKFGNGLAVDTSPASYFPANGYGLYDMAGNLCQWCWDYYGPYVSGVQTNPRGPTAGSFRVLRGGSWLINAFSCRTANRIYYYPSLGGDGYGFRCVLAPQ
jgi:formylglycine-generating enzyme required for sulfatase activity